MLWLLLLMAPFALGLLWGAGLGRRDYFSWLVLLGAPIFSGVLIVGALAVIYTDENRSNPNLSWPSQLVTIVVYGGASFVAGAGPALLGSSAGQFVKLWLFRRGK